MRKYFCDRCKREIDEKKVEKVELDGRRLDVCQAGDCLEVFGKLKAKSEQAADAHMAVNRKIQADLVAEFLKGPDGSPQEADAR